MKYRTAGGALVVSLILALFASLAYYQVVVSISQQREHVVDIKEQMVDLNYRFSSYLSQENISAFIAVIDNKLATFAHFDSIFVLDQRGKVVVASNRRLRNTLYQGKATHVRNLTKGNIAFTKAVFLPIAFDNGETLETYRIVAELSGKNFFSVTDRATIVAVLPLCALFGALLFAILRFLSRHVMRPLRSMHEFAESGAQLAGPFYIEEMEHLRGALLRYREKLDSYNEGLERQVVLRTGELEAINKEQYAIFNAVKSGIALVKERHIIRWNRQLEQLFGYDHKAIEGSATRAWYVNESQYEEIAADIKAQLDARESSQTERQLVRKDGSRFWARLYAKPTDPSHPFDEMIVVIEDITEERANAEALLAAKDAAEAANRSKSTFLANMSHEIRTPMNAILGMTYLGLKGNPSAKQRDYFMKIQTAGQHLLSILNDILDISKIEAGKMEIEPMEFRLDSILSKIETLAEDRINAKGLDFKVVTAPNIPKALVGDELRISQILQNFISNAIKFTEQGSITLITDVVERTPRDIKVAFAVSDTGIGMSPEQQECIFANFQQVDSSTTRKYGGTGLGLSISKRLAQLMGGTIDVSSAEGVGSTFRLTLTLGLAKPEAEEEAVSMRTLVDRYGPLPDAARESVIPVCRLLLELLRDNDPEVAAFAREHDLLLAEAFPETYEMLKTAIGNFDFDTGIGIIERELARLS